MKAPTHNVCIAKRLPVTGAIARSFTQVGVAWENTDDTIKCSLDITVILSPDDELYLFRRKME